MDREFQKDIDSLVDSKLLNKIPISHSDVFKLATKVMSIAETKLKAVGSVKKQQVLKVLRERFGLSATQIDVVSDFIDVAVSISKGVLLRELQDGCKCW